MQPKQGSACPMAINRRRGLQVDVSATLQCTIFCIPPWPCYAVRLRKKKAKPKKGRMRQELERENETWTHHNTERQQQTVQKR